MLTPPFPLDHRADELGVLWPIEILHWPEEAVRNAALAREHRPRLLLVAEGTHAPIDLDGLTDWVQCPATAHEIYTRVEMMQRRAERNDHLYMDDDGLLRRGRRWIAL